MSWSYGPPFFVFWVALYHLSLGFLFAKHFHFFGVFFWRLSFLSVFSSVETWPLGGYHHFSLPPVSSPATVKSEPLNGP